LSPLDVDALLASGALTVEIGEQGPARLGAGLLSVSKAVRAAVNGAGPPRPGQLTLSPAALNLGAALAEAELTVGNSGTEAVRVTGVTTSVPWVSVAATQVEGSGLGRYLLRVSRGSLAAGNHQGSVEFTGDVGSPVRATVSIEVVSASPEADAGPQYVQLLDEDGGRVAYSLDLPARGPRIAFAFPGVEAGRYLLISGTDLDGDGQICEPGEACGRYPDYSGATALTVSGNVAGLEFSTEPRPAAISSPAVDAEH